MSTPIARPLPARSTARITAADAAPTAEPKTAPQTLPERMQAVVQAAYGGPEQLRLDRIAVPRPGPGQVLVRSRASSVNFGDNVMLTGRPWLARLVLGLRRPRQPAFGLDVAGEVVAVGPGVADFAIGDRVFGEVDGAWARYVMASTKKIGRIPPGVSFEAAGAAPVAGVTALSAMRRGGVEAGQRVLINGASGGVGSFAVQMARALGAEVTGVCSGRNRALVEGLGATHVVDYTREDFTESTQRYDMVLDLVGSTSIAACRRLLTPSGVYVSSAGRSGHVLKAFAAAMVHRQVKTVFAPVTTADLDALGALLASGDVRPSIERTWDLPQYVEAMQHQRTGRTRGKCVVRID